MTPKVRKIGLTIISLAGLALMITVGVSLPPPIEVGTYNAMDIGNLPGAVSISPQAINDSREVTGWASMSNSSKIFQYSTGLTDISEATGVTSALAWAINNNGAIVGTGKVPGSPPPANSFMHALVIVGYEATDLDPGVVGTTSALDVNDSLQVVGYSYFEGINLPLLRATLWQDGTRTNLDTVSGDNCSRAYGINNYGIIIGISTIDTSCSEEKPAVWENGTVTHLPLLAEDDRGRAEDINDSGTIVGWSYRPGLQHKALIWTRTESGWSVAQVPNIPGTDSTSLWGINNYGIAVGAAHSTATQVSTAVIYRNGTLQDLNTLVQGLPTGWRLTFAPAINTRAQIIATAQRSPSERRAFLLTTKPISGKWLPVAY